MKDGPTMGDDNKMGGDSTEPADSMNGGSTMGSDDDTMGGGASEAPTDSMSGDSMDSDSDGN